jgi:hypothetical protein
MTGILHNVEWESKSLRKGQLAFLRKDDVMVRVWKDKRLVRMINMIHDAKIVNIGRKDKKPKMEISLTLLSSTINS